MINREEKVKIADFGLAHLAKAQGGLDVTRDHHTMGTLKYMAPEQLTSAKNIDERTDIYSFGVCLYEFLTGKLPLGMFKMPTEVDSALDVRWDEIILRSLRMDPDERFASADEMARALRELATTPRITQAQREKEEDATSRIRGVLSLTTCANCGHESAPTARQCEKCGASLEDIFDACPSCKIENRVDVRQCPGCGADLARHRSKMRKEAQAIQAKARQFVADRQFDSALLELKKLERFHTREYASMKESARAWIERVSQRRERFLRRTYEAGQRMVAEGYIERALEFWSALPDDYEDIAARRKELAAKAEAATAAAAAGNRFYEQGDVARAVAEWEKAAASRPGDIELKERLAVARDQLGNLNLKRSYLREASEEAERRQLRRGAGPLPEGARPGPRDASALLVAQEIEARERELAALKERYLSEAREAAEQGNLDERWSFAGRRSTWTPTTRRRSWSLKKSRTRGANALRAGAAPFRGTPSQADSCGARLPRHHCAGSLVFLLAHSRHARGNRGENRDGGEQGPRRRAALEGGGQALRCDRAVQPDRRGLSRDPLRGESE